MFRPLPSPEAVISFRDESVWHSPLVLFGLAFTSGLLFDRQASPPLMVSLITGAIAGCAWLVVDRRTSAGLSVIYLLLAATALGSAYAHYRRAGWSPDDIGALLGPEPRPVTVRGILDDEPVRSPAIAGDPLRSRDRPESATALLLVTSLHDGDDWQPRSGRLRILGVPLEGLHAGDAVELVGRLTTPSGPANPGEFDQAAYWRERGVRGLLVVRPSPGAVTHLASEGVFSLRGQLAEIRGWAQKVLEGHLPPATSGLATALLLGDTSPLAASEWEKYLRTGVIHILAISGQHLVVLGMVFWWVARAIGMRQRTAAASIAVVLFGYALLTGGRPPALRAAIMVSAAAAGLVLRRRVPLANTFVLAWLAVALVMPADLFSAGSLLSFLAVLVIYWGTRNLFPLDVDPLKVLEEENRPAWQRLSRHAGRLVLEAYLVGALIWLAVTPLAAARYHVVPLVGFLLGPPLSLLASIALIAGFLWLLAAAIGLPVAVIFSPLVHWPLVAISALVDAGDRLPGGHLYVGDIGNIWLAIYYLGLIAVLTQLPLRRAWPWGLAFTLSWLCIGLVFSGVRRDRDEMRATFLAVGHGGCTVLELPDGRTLLYDTGAIAGPDVTRRIVAPFLWSRGIRRIDEVFLSHGDLDHFNGLPDLLQRFRVGQVTCTPTFADKRSPAVAHTLKVLERCQLPVRIVKAGDRLQAGPVLLEVLHPPARGPSGNENARSMVLLVHHGTHQILLTGDLEGPGLEKVLGLPSRSIDVLMAPHHGSPRCSPAELAQWARPRVVIACQGQPLGGRAKPEPYTAIGATYLGTWPHGAVTVISRPDLLTVDTISTGKHLEFGDNRAN